METAMITIIIKQIKSIIIMTIIKNGGYRDHINDLQHNNDVDITIR